MSAHPGDYRPCVRCGKKRVTRYDRRNYCMECRDDTLRPIANWMEHGACRSPHFNPDWWWPERGDADHGNTPLALNICGHCKVRDLCLDYAIQHKEREGIWGGKMAHERKRLAVYRREAVA